MAAKQGENYRAARRNRWRLERKYLISARPWAAFRFATPAAQPLTKALVDLIKEKGIRLSSMKRRTIWRGVAAFEHREYLRANRDTIRVAKAARILERKSNP
jgi:hypothetical protein